MKRIFSSLLCAALMVGCGVDAVEGGDAAIQAQDELSATQQRSAKASGLTVWLDRDVTAVNESDGSTSWMLKGRASKDLTRVFSFICDDALGGATQLDARNFEIKFSWRDFEVALAPRTMYLALTTAAGRDYYLTYTLSPRLVNFSGPTSLWVQNDMEPRTENDLRTWVGEFSTSKPAGYVGVYNDIDTEPEVRQLSPTKWEFVFANTSQLLSHPMGGAWLTFHAEFPDGTSASKSAQIVVSVPSMSLSTQAPY